MDKLAVEESLGRKVESVVPDSNWSIDQAAPAAAAAAESPQTLDLPTFAAVVTHFCSSWHPHIMNLIPNLELFLCAERTKNAGKERQ